MPKRSRRPVSSLCGVGLVAGVPDDAVARAVEHAVERDGQLDDPERAAEVAARVGDGVDDRCRGSPRTAARAGSPGRAGRRALEVGRRSPRRSILSFRRGSACVVLRRQPRAQVERIARWTPPAASHEPLDPQLRLRSSSSRAVLVERDATLVQRDRLLERQAARPRVGRPSLELVERVVEAGASTVASIVGSVVVVAGSLVVTVQPPESRRDQRTHADRARLPGRRRWLGHGPRAGRRIVARPSDVAGSALGRAGRRAGPGRRHPPGRGRSRRPPAPDDGVAALERRVRPEDGQGRRPARRELPRRASASATSTGRQFADHGRQRREPRPGPPAEAARRRRAWHGRAAGRPARARRERRPPGRVASSARRSAASATAVRPRDGGRRRGIEAAPCDAEPLRELRPVGDDELGGHRRRGGAHVGRELRERDVRLVAHARR